MSSKNPAYRYLIAPLAFGGSAAVGLGSQADALGWNIPPVAYILVFFLAAIFLLLLGIGMDLAKNST